MANNTMAFTKATKARFNIPTASTKATTGLVNTLTSSRANNTTSLTQVTNGF